MKDIDYKQLKKYNIGKMPMSSGYLRSEQPITTGFTNTPGYNMSNEISTINRSIIPNSISQAATLGSTINTMTNAYTSASAALTSNLNSAIANGWIAGGKLTETGVLAAINSGIEGVKVGTTAGKQMATKMLGESAKTSGMSAAGTVAGIAGAAMGTYGIVNDIIGFNDRLKSNDMMNMTGRGTESKYGVTYNTYNGLDAQGIKDVTSAQNRAGTFSMAMNGASTGASIGGMIGGPIGMGIGGGIGAFVGTVGGIIGGHHRSKKVEDSFNNVLAYQSGANKMFSSKAGSLGLRNNYNIDHADKGKDIQLTNNGNQGEFRMVHTSEGIKPGVMLGLAGKGESIYNPIKGTASVFDEGKKRVDNIPTGVSLEDYSGTPPKNKYFDGGKMWNSTVIFGNNTNPITGNTFAEDAEGPSRVLEKYNKGRNKMNLSKHTELVNRKNAMNSLNALAGIQSMVNLYNCGKTGKYDDGKPEESNYGVKQLAPELMFAQAPFLLKNYYNAVKETPFAQNSYVANPYGRQALDIQAAAKFDPTSIYDIINKGSRQGLYNIIQQGGITAGQKAALIANNVNNRIAAMMNADVRKQEFDADKYNKYSTSLMNYGQAESTRGQQALATQQEAYAKAVGAKQHLVSQGAKDASQLVPAYMQNRSTYDNFNGMYRLWNKDINLKEKALLNDIKNSKENKPIQQVTTTSSNPYFQNPAYKFINYETPTINFDLKPLPSKWLQLKYNINHLLPTMSYNLPSIFERKGYDQ